MFSEPFWILTHNQIFTSWIDLGLFNLEMKHKVSYTQNQLYLSDPKILLFAIF